MSPVRSIDDISGPKRQEYLARPAFRQRWLTLNILGLAFVVAPLIYLGLLLSGVMRGPEECGEGAPLWPALWAAAVFGYGAMVIVVRRQLRLAQKADRLPAAAGFVQTAFILTAAIGEAPCIYALVGPFLCMTRNLCVALWALGFVGLLLAMGWVRGQGRDLMLLAIAREEEEGSAA